ncbi:hypothetical protein GFS24_09865 [Chitinophaga sp. SYP-B3965]|uniref:hypothetical protein n=1 Tax=Chitinophaga sp. SYP-B3965 TaxID=2663120 RepID=UPI00129998F7|nr:hypothetical protein [Chitinophaga sp. SYP-B3965]MRG45422.1 hypothetical protein [Chitinophaga sp. SYP-B3965]
MRFIPISLLLLLSAKSLCAQEVRNVAWINPVKRNTIVNGISIGLVAQPFKPAKGLTVNGLTLELQPAGALIMMYSLGTTMIPSLGWRKTKEGETRASVFSHTNSDWPDKDSIKTHLRGINISPGFISETSATGVNINIIASLIVENRGLTITGFDNTCYTFSGIMISGFKNKATVGHGLQIAVFNNCREGKVVQLGLFNRIGKRALPFVNVSL